MQMIEVLLLVSNFFSLSLVLGVVTNKDVAAAMENILVLGIQLYGFISLSPCATARALYPLLPGHGTQGTYRVSDTRQTRIRRRYGADTCPRSIEIKKMVNKRIRGPDTYLVIFWIWPSPRSTHPYPNPF